MPTLEEHDDSSDEEQEEVVTTTPKVASATTSASTTTKPTTKPKPKQTTTTTKAKKAATTKKSAKAGAKRKSPAANKNAPHKRSKVAMRTLGSFFAPKTPKPPPPALSVLDQLKDCSPGRHAQLRAIVMGTALGGGKKKKAAASSSPQPQAPAQQAANEQPPPKEDPLATAQPGQESSTGNDPTETVDEMALATTIATTTNNDHDNAQTCGDMAPLVTPKTLRLEQDAAVVSEKQQQQESSQTKQLFVTPDDKHNTEDDENDNNTDENGRNDNDKSPPRSDSEDPQQQQQEEEEEESKNVPNSPLQEEQEHEQEQQSPPPLVASPTQEDKEPAAAYEEPASETKALPPNKSTEDQAAENTSTALEETVEDTHQTTPAEESEVSSSNNSHVKNEKDEDGNDGDDVAMSEAKDSVSLKAGESSIATEEDADNDCAMTAEDTTYDSSNMSDEKEETANDVQVVMTTAAKSAPAKEDEARDRRSRRKSTQVASKNNNNNKLSESMQLQLAKYQSLIDSLSGRAKELLQICLDLDDSPAIKIPTAVHGDNVVFDKETFPDFALEQLSVRLEGQRGTLSSLAKTITEELNTAYETDCFQEQATADKIKLVATRKSYVKTPHVAMDDLESSQVVDAFQDERPAFLWRWELEVLDLLPDKAMASAKKSRAARRKVSLHFNSIAKVLCLLEDAVKLVTTPNTKKARLDKLDTKIEQEKAKFVKLEENDQKQQTKRKRQEEEKKLKDRKKDETSKLKLKAAEDKKRQKLQKERLQKEKQEKRQAEQEAKARKKEEAAKEKEVKKQQALDAKHKKEEEARKIEAKKTAKLAKQQNFMKGFFVKKEKPSAAAAAASRSPQKAPPPKPVEGPSILSQIGLENNSDSTSTPVIPMTLSQRSKLARRPRVGRVSRTVYVSAEDDSEDPWAQTTSFAREETVNIRNLYKFLCFHEDIRPPYFGTFSKTSAQVTGRRPFHKDTRHFDYDYDSEAEWEEGDDELGEDLGVEDNDEEEKDDEGEVDEDDNGWLAGDDDDVEDEETKRLRKKMRLERTKTTMVLIAPRFGGLPFQETTEADGDASPSCPLLEGIEVSKAKDLVRGHEVITAKEYKDAFMAFEPAIMDETSPSDETSKELCGEEKTAFLKFVHTSTISSKEKLVEQFREEHPGISRALLTKTLESVADKEKHPVSGSMWVVKKSILESEGSDLANLVNASMQAKESAQREHLQRVAKLIHHSTATSKEKLADEILAAYSGSDDDDEDDQVVASSGLSRAECLRLIPKLGEKVKGRTSHQIFWRVIKKEQEQLGLNLPTGEPKIAS